MQIKIMNEADGRWLVCALCHTDLRLTDSMAYSTWRRRPSGDQTVTSVSYWLRNMVVECCSGNSYSYGGVGIRNELAERRAAAERS